MASRDQAAATTEPSFVTETLAWCNARRAERDMEPLDRLPMGLREDPKSCPCGRATGLWVDNETYGDGPDNFKDHPLPASVITFVAEFDASKLPQYDEKPPEYEEDTEW